jgi:phosphoglycolate phosphatase-like HAD superfamily hydrolase
MDSWIFFTLDGTLIDSRSAEEKAALLILKDVLGINLTRNKQWTNLWNYTYQRYATTPISDSRSKENIWRDLYREFDPTLTEKDCTDLLLIFKAEYCNHLATFPDVPEALFRLTDHHQMGLMLQEETLSNDNYDIPLGLGSLFRKIISLQPESEVDALLADLSPEQLIGAHPQEKTSFVSSSYSLLSSIKNQRVAHPIWLNRLTSEKAKSFRTISNLSEIT